MSGNDDTSDEDSIPTKRRSVTVTTVAAHAAAAGTMSITANAHQSHQLTAREVKEAASRAATERMLQRAMEQYHRFRIVRLASQFHHGYHHSPSPSPSSTPTPAPVATTITTIDTGSVSQAIVDTMMSSSSRDELADMLPALIVAASRSPSLEPRVRQWIERQLSPLVTWHHTVARNTKASSFQVNNPARRVLPCSPMCDA